MNRTAYKVIVTMALAMLAVMIAVPANTQNTRPLTTTQVEVMQDYARREQTAPPAVRQKLAELRQRIKERNLGFEVGYTYAMERSAQSMTGGILPTNRLSLPGNKT
jgi:hypothetical protein